MLRSCVKQWVLGRGRLARYTGSVGFLRVESFPGQCLPRGALTNRELRLAIVIRLVLMLDDDDGIGPCGWTTPKQFAGVREFDSGQYQQLSHQAIAGPNSPRGVVISLFQCRLARSRSKVRQSGTAWRDHTSQIEFPQKSMHRVEACIYSKRWGRTCTIRSSAVDQVCVYKRMR